MAAIQFYFHVHQPFRLRKYDALQVSYDHNYFHDQEYLNLNKKVVEKIANKCYLPMNNVLLNLLNRFPNFAFSFSITGILIEQLEWYAPQVLESFVRLANTGRVEFISETFYHSLAGIYSQDEFAQQVEAQNQKLFKIFGAKPKVFRNTELIYSNDIAQKVADLGFDAILAEGVDRYLDWRSPNYLYQAKNLPKLKVFLKNYKLSDDIAFRFSQKSWSEWPLTASKFQHWINMAGINADMINLFMDFETFGEHQWEDTGIFAFFEKLVEYVTSDGKHFFTTPSKSLQLFDSKDTYDVPELTSWADTERDLTAWRGNAIQWSSLENLYEIENKVKAKKDPQLLHDWRLLQTSDHFYYMCTKWWNDGDVHAYFSPMDSPFDGYNRFNNALADLIWRLDQ